MKRLRICVMCMDRDCTATAVLVISTRGGRAPRPLRDLDRTAVSIDLFASDHMDTSAETYSADMAKAVPLFRPIRGIYSPVSVDYLPCDAMHKRGVCYRQVSVCLSVRHVDVLYPDGRKYHQTSFWAR